MGFSFISDSDEEKAVDELLSQAMDQSVLEQVAAINCSGFTNSELPPHLDIRFQKLKSFPSVNPKSKPSVWSQSHSASSSSVANKSSNEDKSISNSRFPLPDDGEGNGFPSVEKCLSDSSKDAIFSHTKSPNSKNVLKGNFESGFQSEDEILSVSNKISGGNKRRELNSPSRSSPFRSNSSTESSSPPRKSGCFWCSPKNRSRRKNKENRVLNVSLDWGKNDEILSDVLVKTQQKLINKAIKEEEKICREAEKIVRWAKQASARIDLSSVEDELSEEESLK